VFRQGLLRALTIFLTWRPKPEPADQTCRPKPTRISNSLVFRIYHRNFAIIRSELALQVRIQTHNGHPAEVHEDQDKAEAEVCTSSTLPLCPPPHHVQPTDTSPETSTKSQRTSVHLNISNNTRTPKLQKTCQDSDSSTVSNAQNGLRVSKVWSATAKEAHTREGRLAILPLGNAEL
jgi:hypothetical protein